MHNYLSNVSFRYKISCLKILILCSCYFIGLSKTCLGVRFISAHNFIPILISLLIDKGSVGFNCLGVSYALFVYVTITLEPSLPFISVLSIWLIFWKLLEWFLIRIFPVFITLPILISYIMFCSYFTNKE